MLTVHARQEMHPDHNKRNERAGGDGRDPRRRSRIGSGRRRMGTGRKSLQYRPSVTRCAAGWPTLPALLDVQTVRGSHSRSAPADKKQSHHPTVYWTAQMAKADARIGYSTGLAIGMQ